jgi:uncharacterized protein
VPSEGGMRTAVVAGPRGGRWVVEVPETRAERAGGLLGRVAIVGDRGMLFERARSIHTVGMRFAILAAFLDGQGRVVLTRLLSPGRFVLPRLRVRAVLELAPDADVRVGDVLAILGRRSSTGSTVPAPIV